MEFGGGPDPGGARSAPKARTLAQRLVTLFGLGISFIGISWAAELHLALGLVLYTEQAMSAVLGCALALIFLNVPASGPGPRPSLPWYDAGFALIGVLGATWLGVRYPIIAEEVYYRPVETLAISVVLLPLVIEALRRTSGWTLTIVLATFIAYGLFGHLVPGELMGRSMSVSKLLIFLGIDNTAMLGLPMTIICTVVILFIFMGRLLVVSGASNWFTDMSAALMGRSRGGSAKISVVASSLFGTISGAAVSNVASTGVITIPLMRQAGYSSAAAGAIEAVASTGGQIMPPVMGAAAFLMAEFLEIPYTEVILAALLPAILYYVALFIQTDLEAARRNIAAVPEDQIPPLRRVVKEGWFFTLPFVVLIYSLFELNLQPETAALYAAISIVLVSLVFGYKGHRMTPRDFWNALTEAGRSSADLVVIGAMAGMIIGLISVTGLGFGLTFVLVQFGEDSLLGLLGITAVICIVLGMGMPTTAIYFLLATLAVPPLLKLGVDPVAGHLFVFYFGLMSMITPPVAIAAFAAANLAGASPVMTALYAVRFGWIAYVVPFIFVLSPNLIMRGHPLDIAVAFISAVIGVWLGSVAMMGYFLRPVAPMMRIVYGIVGAGLLAPAQAYEGGDLVRISAAAVAVALIAMEFRARHQLQPS